MNSSNLPAEHQDIWDLIPWFVTGRLSESDTQRAEAHLRQCSACRDELSAQRELQRTMRADTGVEQLPLAGLNRLRQRIDALDLATREPSSEPGEGAVSSGDRPPSLRRFSFAASLIAMTVSLGILGTLVWQQAERGQPAAYYTVTSAAARPANAAIRAVFAPTLTLSELQSMLNDAQLQIVSGPTEAGVYSLAVSDSSSVNWSLQRLRAHDTVRFAEAVVPSSDAARTP